MGNAQLATLDCSHPPTLKILNMLIEQTRRGKNLTRNLVAFAKSHEPRQSFFRINEKIELVLTLLRKDLEGIDINCDHDPDIPGLYADPEMTENALVNVIQNAIHVVSLSTHPQIKIRVREKR